MKKKLDALRGELGDLRVALVVELKKEISKNDKYMEEEAVNLEAEKQAEQIFLELGLQQKLY